MSTTNPRNRTTEWDDLQIKYGNYDPLPPEIKSEEISQQAQDAIASVDPLATKSLRELDILAEDGADEDVIQAYRARRLAEFREKARRARFGELIHIGRTDYLEAVTNASENGQVVVCLLHKDNIDESCQMHKIIQQLAKKHPDTKFVYGISTDLVPGLSDSRVPTLLVYKNKQCIHQLPGTTLFQTSTQGAGAGPGRGGFFSCDSVEWILGKRLKLFDLAPDAENPFEPLRIRKKAIGISANESSEDEEEETGDLRNTAAAGRGYSDTNVESVLASIRKFK